MYGNRNRFYELYQPPGAALFHILGINLYQFGFSHKYEPWLFYIPDVDSGDCTPFDITGDACRWLDY